MIDAEDSAVKSLNLISDSVPIDPEFVSTLSPGELILSSSILALTRYIEGDESP